MKSKISLYIIIFLTTINIGFSQFGTNKVQYEEFNWMYIQTEHFDIYYNQGSKYLAEFAAITAEESLQYIQNSLNYAINRRVPIILYNSHVQFQQTNAISSYMPEGVGGVTELFKNRVVLPFNGNWESFRHVIAHELVHAVINDMFYGGTFQTALATGSLFEFPIWMSEGLSEWLSLRTLTTQTDMFIRDLVINNLLPDLPRLDGYLAYRGGQIFYWYVATNYGQEKIGELINKMGSFRNADLAFKNTFGLTLEEFSDKWMKDIKKLYLPDVKEFQDPDDFAENLTNHKKTRNYWNTSPSISPNGQKFAYIGVEDGVFAIFVRDFDKKSEPRKLVSSFRQLDFEELNILTPGISWSPKGDKLAISAKAGGENAIFIVDEKTGYYEKLTFGLKSITSVTWSPDGKYLSFTASLPNQSDIFIYEFKTKKITNLTNDIYSDAIPEWSHDSRSIYFVSDRGDDLTIGKGTSDAKIWMDKYDRQDIYSIDISSKSIIRWTFDEQSLKTSIAAPQNPNKILFVSDLNGISNLYELDLNTRKVTTKTNSIIGINQISLSPDGSKLLFSGQTNGGYDIFLMNFPFEKKIEKGNLPLTTYKQGLIDNQKIVEDFDNTLNSVSNQDTTKISYGRFSVDFSRQNFVEPNPDASTRNPNLISKGENLTKDQTFVEKPYKITFTPDAIIGNPNYNTFYGFQSLTQMLFSDIMGDHQIYVQGNILGDLRNSSFLVNYSYLPGLIDYGFTFYHSSLLAYLSDSFIYRLRNYGLSVDASMPFDLFRRLEFNLGFMNLSKENVDIPTIPSVDRMLILPSVRYVFDNVIGNYYGPSLGMRYYFSVTGSPKISSSGASFINFDTDIRGYMPIIANYLTLALRGTAGASFGSNPVKYYLGGTENWINSTFFGNGYPFDDPIDFGFMNYKMPARGWSVGQHYGSKFFLVNTELRFPLFTALVAGPIPILLQGVMGNMFLDVAGAFNDKFVASQTDVFGNKIPKDLFVSAGIGARTFLLGLPIKFDVAWRNEFRVWSEPYYLFSLGYDF